MAPCCGTSDPATRAGTRVPTRQGLQDGATGVHEGSHEKVSPDKKTEGRAECATFRAVSARESAT